MTVLGHGLVFQPVLVTQTCTYNSKNITLTLQIFHQKKKKKKIFFKQNITTPLLPPPKKKKPHNNNKRERDRQTDRQTDRQGGGRVRRNRI